ncbi:cyclic nucleotide-binding domain-containing protein [Desulfopila sp. IMCC35008]|uniref:cyclic nucleotide-binding domain-containing protein n=1 Tax=Desulfopila sp. IMCC35008 TaxID=2653858 RepID=UPI0013D764F6|nr:cyclic nucleotide-binding domain-containing protein [Desulfopila sp. IMCC35008]
MIEASHQQELFDTLKAVNNASVSIRLYPANSPQITNAIERGYKQLKQFLRNRGTFFLAIGREGPEIGGMNIPEETLKSFANLTMYRQLELLGQNCLAIGSGIDRTTFRKILDLFAAKVDRIKEEGGGARFIARLGLGKYFPDDVEQVGVAGSGGERPALAQQGKEHARIPAEYLNVLLGIGSDSDVISRVGQLMFSVEKGSSMLAGAVCAVIEDILKKGIFGAVPALADLLSNSSRFIPDENREAMAEQTAANLLKRLSNTGTVLFFAHRFQDRFGESVSSKVINQASFEVFERVVGVLRSKSEKLRETQTSESPQLVFISAALSHLMSTGKGKQFLGQEKANTILKAGEQSRRAQRVQSSVKTLMKGNREVLKSDEFCLHLPIIVERLKGDGREKEVMALLGVLLKEVKQSSGDDQERMITSLVKIGEILVQDNPAMVEDLTLPLIGWLRESKKIDKNSEKCCFVLQSLMNHFYRKDIFDKGDAILATLFRLRSGAIDAPAELRAQVASAQDGGVDRQVVKKLLEMTLANPNEEAMSRRITLQGPVVCRFLVESLIRAEHSQDRMKIIDLLTRGEKALAPIIVEKLSEPMPWYGKRNLLKLLGDNGNESHIEVVHPFLQTEDLRVQREAFICLYKISGKKRKQVLLRALNDAGETIKLEIVRALVNFGDVQVVHGLGQVLQDHMYYSDDFRDSLLAEVCRALGHCRVPDAEKELRKFDSLRNTRQGKKIGDRVWKSVADGLNQLAENQQDERVRQARASKLRKNALSRVGSTSSAQQGRGSITGLAEERKIQELFDKGNINQAKVLFLELLTKVLRLRRFTQAEQLREWLLASDSTALAEVIKAADMIEEAKMSSVDSGHLKLWADLFDTLSSEEFSALYHNLMVQRFDSEASIVKKGEMQNLLYFINSGKVKLFYPDKSGETLIKTVGSGSVFGAETFFGTSVWTHSATALGPVELAVFTHNRLDKLREEYPGIERKLQDFCESEPLTQDIFIKEESDRRDDTRVPVSGGLVATLLGESKQSAGVTLQGKMLDIATGGLSFLMGVSQKDNSRLLLGRTVKLTLKTVDSASRTVVQDGTIVAIRPQGGAALEYSIHVKFRKPLDPGYLEKIVKML